MPYSRHGVIRHELFDDVFDGRVFAHRALSRAALGLLEAEVTLAVLGIPDSPQALLVALKGSAICTRARGC